MPTICGITTAPRPEYYLDRTLESLSRAGFDSPIVFAEPGSRLPGGVNVVQRASRLGVFGNWQQALGELSDNERVLLCQDDIVCCRGLREFCDNVPLDGVLSLYTSAKHAGEPGIVRFTVRDNPWGACAYLFSGEIAKQVSRMPWESDRRVEHFLTRALESLGLSLSGVRPSLVQHIGCCRTDGTTGRAQGWLAAGDFVGENASALDLASQFSQSRQMLVR